MKQTFKKLLFGTMLAAGLVTNVHAQLFTIQFTDQSTLDGSTSSNDLTYQNSGAATGNFATLTFDSFTNAFNLSVASNISDFFSGSGIYIDAFALETNQNPVSGISATSITGNSGVVTVLDRSDTSLPSGFNVRFIVNGTGSGNADELDASETLAFTLAGNNPNCLTATTGCAQNSNQLTASTFALRVRSSSNTTWALGRTITSNNGVLAVPEAEITTMMLAGLGLISFVSRRRKQT